VESTVPLVINADDIPALLNQLLNFGFTPDQSRKAVEFLSNASPFTSNLLSTLSPLEACIEYLVLHVPECDLPQRFMPSINSSNPFITGAHSGTADLKKRWLEERMVKEGGWPSHIVKNALEVNPFLVNDQASLVSHLGRRLLGVDDDIVADDGEGQEEVNADEIESLGGSFVEPGHLVVPLPMSPFKLHMFLPSKNLVSSDGPPMYISSDSVPAYIRLHLLAIILKYASESVKEPHESFLGVCVRIIEECWVNIEDNGPPNVSEVLRCLVLRRKSAFEESDISPVPSTKKEVTERRQRRGDNRTGGQIKDELEAVRRQDKYRELLVMRGRLPAFSAKDNFLSTLEKNRVVVVVGETGSRPSFYHYEHLTYSFQF
jgi:ATP-dependent RNA helicase DHX57